jgi:hypothetical protein
MDMKEGDVIVSVAIVREGQLSEGSNLSGDDEEAAGDETLGDAGALSAEDDAAAAPEAMAGPSLGADEAADQEE